MASRLNRIRLVPLAALFLIAASLAQLPAAWGQEAASAPEVSTADRSQSGDDGLIDPDFDPRAQGASSVGVAYPDPRSPSGWMCFGRHATIVGTPHNDRIYGTKNQDVIVGLGGRDLITAGEKNDRVCGGDGDDQVYGLNGNDFIDGDDNNDSAFGGNGDDRMFGSAGDDTMNGEGGTDFIYGSAGRDTVNGGFAGEAEGGTDTGTATAIRGLAGDSNDFLFGGGSNDTLNGGDGNDNIYGQAGNDTLEGDDLGAADADTLANDRMVGGPGRDVFLGGPGNDTMTGKGGDDIFSGGPGNDTAWGDGGNDIVSGGAGSDTVWGGSDDDVANGEEDGDSLNGDGGDDILCGGADVDTLAGGSGGDLISGEADDCTFSTANLLSKFSADSDALNLIQGGDGQDLCVSPSTLLSLQTQSCEFTGIIKLSIKIEGSGSVDSNMLGALNEFPIDCSATNGAIQSGSICEMYFLPSEVPVSVDLTATPGGSSVFLDWAGVGTAPCGSNTACTVTFDRSITVTATFATAVSLTVVVNGPGTVTGPGIACPGDCSQAYAQGASVGLTATGTITNWVVSGPVISTGCTAGNTACNISMTTSGSVTVNTT